MANTHKIEIDALQSLENFRDAYDDTASVVVLEAIANALDVGATEVDIKLENRHISFRDNGPGMNRRIFKSYHNISHSTKTKGHGIGFAGVGAKIYLAIWKQTVIHTETYGQDGPFASDMRVIRRKLIWDELPTSATISGRGTLYSVKLREADYKILDGEIEDIVYRAFNPAMLNGFTVTINGNRLRPWDPPHEFRREGVANAKGMKLPVRLTVTDEDTPEKYRHVQYQVWGKTVTTKKLDWVNEISEPYRSRVHVWVDAEKCSKHLKINKGSFKSGQRQVSDMYKAVNRWVSETLRENGYVKREGGQTRSNPKLSRFFQNLFRQEEYRWLDPNTTTGVGSGSGAGIGRGGGTSDSGSGESNSENSDKRKNGASNRRGGSGISITFVDEEDDQRDGWLDPETNNFVCNRGHRLYRKYEKNPDARNQRVKTILFMELIRYGAKKEAKEVSEALDAHSRLMTLAKDLEVT